LSEKADHLPRLITKERELRVLSDVYGAALHTTILRNFEENITAATEAYNIAVCRGIGPAVYATLPRELRDMIYSYLLPTEALLIVRTTTNLRCSAWGAYQALIRSGPYLVTYPRSSKDEICPEHYWRDNAVGSNMA
jgi:hypothetical protein